MSIRDSRLGGLVRLWIAVSALGISMIGVAMSARQALAQTRVPLCTADEAYRKATNALPLDRMIERHRHGRVTTVTGLMQWVRGTHVDFFPSWEVIVNEDTGVVKFMIRVYREFGPSGAGYFYARPNEVQLVSDTANLVLDGADTVALPPAATLRRTKNPPYTVERVTHILPPPVIGRLLGALTAVIQFTGSGGPRDDYVLVKDDICTLRRVLAIARVDWH